MFLVYVASETHLCFTLESHSQAKVAQASDSLQERTEERLITLLTSCLCGGQSRELTVSQLKMLNKTNFIVLSVAEQIPQSADLEDLEDEHSRSAIVKEGDDTDTATAVMLLSLAALQTQRLLSPSFLPPEPSLILPLVALS